MRLLCYLMGLSLLAFQTPNPEQKTDEKDPVQEATLAPDESMPESIPSSSIRVQKLDYDTNIWFDLEDLDPSIQLELRYATTNNFVQEVMYDCGRCFLRREVAKAVIRAHQDLQAKGYGGLKMFDCYRPRPIQWKLWEKVPNPDYVADPRKGSMHNRGAATDLTIVDKAGQELEMGTEFDFFGKEAHHDYTGHSAEVQANRDLLKATMDRQGFRWIRTEWWHYSYRPKTYEISDMLWDCE